MCVMENKEKKEPVYMPVKDYAAKYNLTVQAVYQRAWLGKILSKRIGSYTLVADPA